MHLIDTHSHLYARVRRADREEALARAVEAGVGALLLPAIDSESHEGLFALCRSHPERRVPMMGLHPTSVNDNPRWREELALVARYLDARRPPASTASAPWAKSDWTSHWSDRCVAGRADGRPSRRSAAWAAQRDLPVAIHSRAAGEAQMCAAVAAEAARGPRASP